MQTPEAPKTLTPYERAARYVAASDGAVSGQNGHSQTYAIATALYHGFNLNEAEAFALLQEYNAKCSPPWSERELRHKLNSAMNREHNKPRGWLLGIADPAPRKRDLNASRVTQSGKFKVNLGNLSPVPVLANITTKQFLETVFKAGEVVCITNEALQDEDGKYQPASKGTFQKLEWWLENFLGESPRDPSLFDHKPQGAWLRINPCKEGDYTGRDDGVAAFRHILVEFDDRPKEEQFAIFKQSNLPISAVVDSGGKSLHAWVRVDAKDFEEWRERRKQVFEYLSDYEPDKMTINPSRLARLGGVHRGDNLQAVVALNLGLSNWDEWVSYVESQEVPTEISVDDLYQFSVEEDPTTVLGNRWLCEGGSLCVVGQSGTGKSSFLMQMAIMLSIGRPFFGIQVKRPYRCIIMQAENDTGDLAEAFQGIVGSMSLTEGEVALLRSNLKFYRETVKVGLDFVKMARRLIVHNKADFFFADPLLAFAGGDMTKNEYATQFLRNWIQPVLMETKCVWVFLHHTGKPKASEVTSSQTVSDIAYSGIGASELTNWAREVAVLRRTDKVRPFFELVLTKRGKRAGLIDKDGKPTAFLNLRHAEGKILWEINDENTLNKFSLKDLQKMEDMPPTEHLSDPERSPMVRHIAHKLAVGTATAGDVAAQLIRLTTVNPIIVWEPKMQKWHGVKWNDSTMVALDNQPF